MNRRGFFGALIAGLAAACGYKAAPNVEIGTGETISRLRTEAQIRQMETAFWGNTTTTADEPFGISYWIAK